MEVENIDLIAKLAEYENRMSSRMVDQLDGMIASNRENIRMKCLEAVLKYCEIIKWEFVKEREVKSLAEEFYQFVKGE